MKLKEQKVIIYIIISNIIFLADNQQNNNNSEKKSNEQKEGMNILSIDFENINNRKMRIETPHSREALLELGLTERDLFKIDMKKYLSANPELKSESKEIQEKRYNHYDEKRQQAIEEVIKKGKKLFLKKKMHKKKKIILIEQNILSIIIVLQIIISQIKHIFIHRQIFIIIIHQEGDLLIKMKNIMRVILC